MQSFKNGGGIRLFKNLKVLLISAIFIALSIVLGKQLSFTLGPIRISFENLTILMAGILFGPIIGAIVGIAADLIGCVIVGYTIIPYITLGAASIGFISGLISFYFFENSPKKKITVSVMLAHLVGSVIIKTIGLCTYYAYPISIVFLRIPTYLIIASLEGIIIYSLLNNKAFIKEYSKIKAK